MKTINTLLLSLLLALSLASCSSYGISQEGYDALEEKYYILKSEHENALSYYESLCDNYGYLTYDMVKNPEFYRCYMQGDLNHLDWLCSSLDRDEHYICGGIGSILTEYGTVCPLCYVEDEDVFFLDAEAGIFHDQKWCLVLDTEDFKSPEKTYKFVFYDSAVKAGYTPCPECLNT